MRQREPLTPGLLVSKLLRVLWARRWIVIVPVICCMIGGAYVATTSPRIYMARARVILDLVKLDEQSGAPLSRTFAEPYVASQLFFLKDIDVTGRVVDQAGWLDDPGVAAQFAQQGGGDGDMRAWMARGVSAATSARLLPDSSVFEILYRSTSPEMARQIVDAIRRAYIDASLERRRNTARDQGAWFDEQAGLLQQQIAKMAAERDKLQKATGVVFQADDVDLDSAELARMAKRQQGAVIIGPQRDAADAVALSRLDQTIAQQSAALGPNHPNIVALRRSRALLDAKVNAQRQAAQAVVAQAVAASQNMLSSIDLQREKVTGKASDLAMLRQVQDQITVMSQLYSSMAARSADQQQKADVSETELVPVGAPEVDPKPYFPNPSLIMGGTAALGLALGVSLALFIELLSRRVRGVADLASATMGPVLGVVRLQKASAGPKRAKKAPKRRRSKPSIATEPAVGAS